MFMPSFPPLRKIVIRMPSLSATGGAANAESFEMYGASANAPPAIALPFRNRRRDTDWRSNTLRSGKGHLRAQHHQRQQVDEGPIHPRMRVGALRGEPALQAGASVARRAVDAEHVERVLHRVVHV